MTYNKRSERSTKRILTTAAVPKYIEIIFLILDSDKIFYSTLSIVLFDEAGIEDEIGVCKVKNIHK